MGLFKRGKSKNEEGYGRGEAKIHFRDDVLLGEDEIVRALLACVEAPDYRPPTLPKVAIDLMRLSQQPDVDFEDVTKLLEQDSLIAGRVLKTVQSPIYAGASRITSLGDALSRLGLKALRDLVIEISMNLKVYKCDDYAETMEYLRRHSTATAHLAKLLSKHTPVDGEYAFMAGLLHDVGIAGVLLALSEGKGKRKKAPDLISIWPAVERVHARTGEIMAKQWELPMELQIPLTAHHQVMIEGRAHPLAATLCLADDLAHSLGFTVIPPQEASEREAIDGGTATGLEMDCLSGLTKIDKSGVKTLLQAQKALELSDDTMTALRAEAEELGSQLTE